MSEKMRKAVGREFDRLDGVMNCLNAVRAARQYADSAGIPLVAKEHIRGLALLLESVLAEQPAQGEPIGAVHTSGDVCRWMPHFAHPMYAADFRPLYTPPPAPIVPDELKAAIEWAAGVCHDEGWDRTDAEKKHLAALKRVYLAAAPEVEK